MHERDSLGKDTSKVSWFQILEGHAKKIELCLVGFQEPLKIFKCFMFYEVNSGDRLENNTFS